MDESDSPPPQSLRAPSPVTRHVVRKAIALPADIFATPPVNRVPSFKRGRSPPRHKLVKRIRREPHTVQGSAYEAPIYGSDDIDEWVSVIRIVSLH